MVLRICEPMKHDCKKVITQKGFRMRKKLKWIAIFQSWEDWEALAKNMETGKEDENNLFSMSAVEE